MPHLIYVADPMCSWCWGFARSLEALEERAPEGVTVRLVMGGLAPDSDEPMPEATRRYIQAAWDAVEARTGASFNRDFWTQCSPRRSTWMSCRSVIAAEQAEPGAGRRMFGAIQRAYYQQARNPSEVDTLVEVAGEVGLDGEEHRRALASPEVEAALRRDFELRDELGVTGYPSVALERADGTREVIIRGYADPDECRGMELGALFRG